MARLRILSPSLHRSVKTPYLICLFALSCSVHLHAQQLNAPSSLQPSTTPSLSRDSAPAANAPTPANSAAEVQRLAEEAQKSLYQTVDKSGASTAKSASGSSQIPVRLTSHPPVDPTRWARDSVRKLAVMDVAFGGSRETVMIELYPDDAPQTVANFIHLCESGFYNGLAFHRAIEGFLVQTGDPLTSDESAREKWGTGGEERTLPAEIKRPHRLGAVAMARRSDKVNPQRRSNSSQFYICLGNYGSIDGKYTVFGQVVAGLDAMKRLSSIPVDANDCPIARVEVKSMKIIEQKGPLQIQQVAGNGDHYTKPDSARSFMGRFFHRIW